MDRRVANKTLHTELGRKQTFRERFHGKAHAVAKLTHTNIIRSSKRARTFCPTTAPPRGGMATLYILMEHVEAVRSARSSRRASGSTAAMPADKALTVTADVPAEPEISHQRGARRFVRRARSRIRVPSSPGPEVA